MGSYQPIPTGGQESARHAENDRPADPCQMVRVAETTAHHPSLPKREVATNDQRWERLKEILAWTKPAQATQCGHTPSRPEASRSTRPLSTPVVKRYLVPASYQPTHRSNSGHPVLRPTTAPESDMCAGMGVSRPIDCPICEHRASFLGMLTTHAVADSRYPGSARN